MSFNWKPPHSKKPSPRDAAENLYREVKKIRKLLKWNIGRPGERQKKLKMRVHILRDEYNRNRGCGDGSELVRRADRICHKLREILCKSPGDWNNRVRGQQFRWLDEWLIDFHSELYRLRLPTMNT